MTDFVAIDFETANEQRSSICSVGIVIVKGGEIVDTFYSLVKPAPDYYTWFCMNVHGIGPSDTDSAPVFPVVWEAAMLKIQAYFPCFEDGEVPFVAHNAPFDSGCLRAALRTYQMPDPGYPFCCTLARSRQVWREGSHCLDVIAARVGYDLTDHHHALADAEACARIAIEIL